MGLLDNIAATSRDLASWVGTSDEDVPLDEMRKALEATGLAEPTEEKPRALFHDPYSVMDWGGWRQRPSSLTYEALRQMSVQNTVIAAIIQLRTNQIASFARPQQGVYDKGYRLILRDRRDNSKQMTEQEQKMSAELEAMLETTAVLLPDERPSDRDSFRSFLKKSTRDALTYDQWCHPAGTQVLMAEGRYKDIEDVQLGDLVVTHEGRPRRVIELFSRAYTGTMCRLKYRGQTIEATECHPFLVERHPHLAERRHLADKRYHREWVEAVEVQTGQYLVCPDFELPQEEFAGPDGTKATFALARVLGLYAGDGHNQHGVAVWTFHEDEQYLADAIKSVFPSAAVKSYESRRAISVRVRGVGDWFSEQCGSSSGEKRVPRCILAAARDLKNAFLKGYIESDGHLVNASAVLATTSMDMRAGVTLLCGSLGMFVSWSETSNAAHGWAPCWQGRLSGDSYRSFAEAENVRIPLLPFRQRNPTTYVEGHHYLRVNEVSCYEVEDLQVYNFEVEEDHSYIANGIVSHNCFEKIRDRGGRISRFICLPGETIRPAVADVEHMTPEQMRDRVAYVQVYDNTVISEFGVDDLAWCIQNPRSDLRTNGFGFAPTEQIVRLVTAWLYGFEYNSRFFTQGSAIKGVLNIKGAIPDRQLRAFRRMWYSMISGVQNAWKTPILNSEEIQWISMHANNRDMEYGAWMDWLTKLTCSVYGIDQSIKGVLNIKGAIPDRQLRAFRRMWYSMISGVQNAWKTPILNSEEIQWISMHANNRDMEYGAWMDWLTKLTCSVYGIDPTEINFIFGNTGQKGGLNQARPNKDEIVESKDKGLVPLADHVADCINRHIIWEIAPELEFAFTGMDAKAEKDERERRTTEVEKYKTVNEIRAEQDLEPDPHGDIILNPVYLQYIQGQEAEGGGGDLGEGESDGAEDAHEDNDDDMFDDKDESMFGGDKDDDDFGQSQNNALAASASVNTLVGEELRKATRRETVTDGKRHIEVDL